MQKRGEVCLGVSTFAERFSDSSRRAMITFRNRRHSFEAVHPWTVRSNGKQLYFDRIGKSENSSGTVKCHVGQRKDVYRFHGKSLQ